MSIVINPISPVALSVFGLDIRWYALAYVVAFVVGFVLFKKLNQKSNIISAKSFDDLFTYIVIGVILGGRLGYVLFYNLPYFINNPLEIFAVWHGGMSFHGGMIGVLISVFLFAYTQCAKFKVQSSNKNTCENNCTLRIGFCVLDMLAVIAPIGLFFGRIANFINMELMGHVTNRPWGVVFNGYDIAARHPTPLYEAGLEGIVLFAIMFCLWRFTGLRKCVGALSGVFGMGYAAARIFVEFFRVPDAQIGYLLGTGWLTMGMVLSGVMFIAAAGLFAFALQKK